MSLNILCHIFRSNHNNVLPNCKRNLVKKSTAFIVNTNIINFPFINKHYFYLSFANVLLYKLQHTLVYLCIKSCKQHTADILLVHTVTQF